MCDINLDQCEVWRETKHKARTQKQCSSCRGNIWPGETYTKHFSKYDGNITSDVMCEPCKLDRATFADAHDGMSPTPSYFPEMLQSCVSEGDEASEWAAMLQTMDARAAARKRSLTKKETHAQVE